MLKKSLRYALIFCMMICVVISTAKADAPYTTEAMMDFDDYVNERFDIRDVVCGAVIIHHNGKLVYELPYGTYNKRNGRATQMDTDFKLASLTKFISAIGLMKLQEQGLFDLDAPLQEVLPYVVNNPYYKDFPVTARQVLSHTSSFEQTLQTGFDWKKIKKGTPYYHNDFAPGEEYAYSNINGGLFGSMMEALSGQSVFSYMTQEVFDPLGIEGYYVMNLHPDYNSAASNFDKDQRQISTPGDSVIKGESIVDKSDPMRHLGLTVGGLYMDAQDVSVILNMMLQGGIINGVRMLEEETVALMETQQNTIEGSTVRCHSKYGLGTQILEEMAGGTWYGHQGIYNGTTTDAFYQKETGLSVVVIANGHNCYTTDGIANIAREVMDMSVQYAMEGKFEQEELCQKQFVPSNFSSIIACCSEQ